MRRILVEAEVDLTRAAEMVGFDVEALRGLVQEGLLECGPGSRSPFKFGEICRAMATLNFRRASGLSKPGEDSQADDAAHICMLPMAAFASSLAQARYGFEGNLVRTTHPSHVPERYVILHGNGVVRVGTLEAFERAREQEPRPSSSIFIFDTKAAAEHLVNELRATPYRWAASDT